MDANKYPTIFSDEDLKIMKDMGKLSSSPETEFRDLKIQALIARLESAELVIEATNGFYDHSPTLGGSNDSCYRAANAYQAWCKVAGRKR